MEQINQDKRDKIKKSLLISGIIGLLSLNPVNSVKEVIENKDKKINKIYIRDEKDRIIAIFYNGKNYKVIYNELGIEKIEEE